MANKIFGADYVDITSPTGSEKVTVNDGAAFKDVTLANIVGQVTHNATGKSTPVDADELMLWNSVSGLLNKLTWANLKATLNAVYDWATVAHAATGKTTPVDADELSIVDSAAANVIKKLTWANLKATLKTYFDTLYQATGSYLAASGLSDWDEQSSTSSPASSKMKLYFKTNEKIYKKNSSGTETEVGGAAPDGWYPVTDTWTYASATTITVPSGAANLYSVGDKIKLTQTTVKYFYIIGVADTLLTITAGTLYTLTNAAISNVYHSKAVSPLGFPAYMTYSPTWASSGTQPSIGNGTISGLFKLVGKEVTLYDSIIMGTTTTFGTGTYTLTVPITVQQQLVDASIGLDSSTGTYYSGSAFWNGSTTTFVVISSAGIWGATVPVTWASSDYIVAQYKYYIS